MSAISDIRKDIPIHLELASMTDKDYMSSIMQEVYVENSRVLARVTESWQMIVLIFHRSLRSSVYLITFFCFLLAVYAHCQLYWVE